VTRHRKRSLLVVLLALVFPTLITWLYFVALRTAPAAVQQTTYAVSKAIQFVLPVVWVYATNRQDLRLLRPRARGLPIGLLFGLVIGFAMWALYDWVLKPTGFFTGPTEQVRAKVVGMGLDSTVRYAAVGLFYALFHSFLEEYYWRWFVFRELRAVTRLPTAILVSSLGFMAHHILVLALYFGWSSPATWLFSVSVAIGGAIWAWMYERTQSLLGPWASHCLVDAMIFLIGYDLVRDVLS
jgi:membrane protease YdiL (CAAX protease family)